MGKIVGVAKREVAGKAAVYVLSEQNGKYFITVYRAGESESCAVPYGIDAFLLFFKTVRGKVTPFALIQTVDEQ